MGVGNALKQYNNHNAIYLNHSVWHIKIINKNRVQEMH